MSSDIPDVFPIQEILCVKNMAVALNDWPPKMDVWNATHDQPSGFFDSLILSHGLILC